MINREQLLAITELNLAGRIGQMEEGRLNNYVQLLNQFTENYPEQEEEIKSALEAQDYASLSKYLSAIRDTLENIYADELAQDCIKQLNGLGSVKYEKFAAYMTYLLKSLSMLSIDIQIAFHKNQDAGQDLYAKKESAAYNKEAKSKKTILAVDDTAFFLTVLKKALHDTEYRLTCAVSGESALKFLQKHEPDLFLLDIDMPEMDGYELAAKIRESGQKAPIVFLTGNSQKEHVIKAIEVGAADFIVKPINQEDVLAKISKYL
jgi:CheY-like chemotaxis protein/HPt (histidine-containing phosphotransfer) domain-containing protein